MPRVSVIVPVYNVEAYLTECVESILNQSLKDLELILIDDGSPDSCGKICDEYSAKDSRVRVIHQENHGVSYARNAGLNIATGDYIGFVDPDDYIAPDMFETMLSAAEENDCNIAICGFTNCRENGELIDKSSVPAGVFSKEKLILSIYGMPNRFHGSMCNKIFSRNILDGLLFDETVAIGEDWLLLYDCYLKTEKAVAVDGCFYNVRNRNNSATRKPKASLYIKKLKTYLRLYCYAKKQSKEVQKKAAEKILDACCINKNDIIRDDYDKKSISFVNRKLRQISIREFLLGNLPLKKAVYHFIKGLQY